MRLSIWPGLSLAGGVVIVAVVALLVIGGPPGADHGSLPSGSGPGDTRLFPPRHGAPHVSRSAPPGPTSDAAASQYGAQGTRGTVLGEP